MFTIKIFKTLVATKIPTQTNAERDKERNWNKNCKTSKSRDSKKIKTLT